jgi:predicted nucleotidyltransferase
MEGIARVTRWGNSGGILVPREWLDKQVKVILVDRTDEIKKEIFDILNPYLEKVIGIYLVGSYARGEQEKNSDIDIIVISKGLRKSIKSGKYDIEIYTLESIKKTIKNNPIMILPSLFEAKTILNRSLLEELIVKPSRESFRDYFEECLRIIKLNRELIEMDKLNGEFLESDSVVYSCVLRLRGVYMIKTLLDGKVYSGMLFKKWLIREMKLGRKDIEEIYEIYKNIRDNKKVKSKVKIEIAEKFINLLGVEVEKLGK